jgi:hypothetical protein
VRDLEALDWVKTRLSAEHGAPIYKQVTILDMQVSLVPGLDGVDIITCTSHYERCGLCSVDTQGFGTKHMGQKFRAPVQELIKVRRRAPGVDYVLW